MELAKLQDGQLVYGQYEEVEAYADEQGTCVDIYFDHINPSTVYKNFKYKFFYIFGLFFFIKSHC